MHKREPKIEIKKYIKIICIVIIILFVIYLGIWLFFFIDGIIPNGPGLTKSDWLAFAGAYIAFAGTTSISFIALYQSNQVMRFERERINNERFREIQPVLTIDLHGTNKQIPGTAEAISINKSPDKPPHNNFILEIGNQGKYPIQHIIIGDQYWLPYITSNTKVEVCGAFKGSLDLKKWIDKVIEFDQSICGGELDGYPKNLVINYEDVDGNEVFQSFILKYIADKLYYAHENTEKV